MKTKILLAIPSLLLTLCSYVQSKPMNCDTAGETVLLIAKSRDLGIDSIKVVKTLVDSGYPHPSAEALVNMVYTSPQYSGVSMEAAVIQACEAQKTD